MRVPQHARELEIKRREAEEKERKKQKEVQMELERQLKEAEMVKGKKLQLFFDPTRLRRVWKIWFLLFLVVEGCWRVFWNRCLRGNHSLFFYSGVARNV